MRIMKLTIAAFAALMSMGAVASAADLGRGSYKDEPILAPVATWAGFYIGGNAGAAFFDNDNDGDDDDGDDDSDDTVFIGGLHVGYNRQAGNIVYGLEADVNFADDVDYLASVRARLGFTYSNALIYATAGYAFGEDDITEFDGFVGGVGFEKKLRENVSVGLEGLYYAVEADDDSAVVDDEVDFFTVRARLTFHLNRHEEALK